MCPPATHPFKIDLYWSDECIILSLQDYLRGSDLPDNVLAEPSPFLCPPSNLPEGIWYLVRSNEKKESAHGFWKARGEACEVYSNTMITGWRTTLEYFEGIAPDGKITDWLMQEYMITSKEPNDKHEPKGSRLLCSIFLCSGRSSRSEMNDGKCKTIIESKNANPVVSVNPNTNITSDQYAGNETQAKIEHEVATLLLRYSDEDYISRGDFLELNDLGIPGSHSSSSQNSSCPSNLSEVSFGSSAFLPDNEEVANTLKREEEQHPSSSSYKFTAPAILNDVVLQPPLSGSSILCSVRADVAEISGTNSSTDNNGLTDGEVQGSSTTRHNPKSKTEGGLPSEEKKAGSSRMKKFRTYFCLAAF